MTLETKRTHFIRNQIESDLSDNSCKKVITRFPPEPNGYLHIGHAKSICLNFGLATDYVGECYLRFDDTNPTKEDEEYVFAIMEDVQWLGFQWDGPVRHASDYFEQLYHWAVLLIEHDKAYVDSLSGEDIREHRGTLQLPGRDSPYRNRPLAESLELFRRMRNGEFEEGQHVLRAKIDMSSPNINLRDPILYRIRFAHHQRTHNEWCIYPMYDYAHPLSDAIEEITHSLCTLEFQDHRPLYDWLINVISTPATPKQYEFARLNLSHTITSKRKLRQLVEENHVSGWDDPRLPTLQGLRRRGYPPKALRDFCELTGISKSDSVIAMSVLEECVREELNQNAHRAFCVIDPIKVIIENYPENKVEILSVHNHPQQPEMGVRDIPFSRELYIERSDFMEDAPSKFFRLSINKEVRLRHAYIIKCHDIVKNTDGQVIELRCTVDLDTLGKNPEGRKVKGVIHWVSIAHAIDIEVRLYDRLFNIENPAAAEDFIAHLNPHSLDIVQNAKLEPALKTSKTGDSFQFERIGYFTVDKGSTSEKPVYNRVVSLRDGSQFV